MDEIGENLSTCNFTMLSKRLHTLFIQYILDGRTRAPREADLTFLTSTFQCGAKTDRRALQSKFKSWAKRMVVKNHKLILTCSGKEIIPLEESCEVVMRIHFQGHLSVGKVIMQIQKQYTWSKKNFGMSREMVVSFILKNCSNLDCIKKIENEICRNYRCDDFIKDVIVASESRIHELKDQINQSCALTKDPPTSNNLLMACSSPIDLSSSICDIQYGCFSNFNACNLPGVMPLRDKSLGEVHAKDIQCNSVVGQAIITNNFKASNDFKPSGLRERVPSSSNKKLRLSRSYLKPKNINEFQILLDAAEQFKGYPAILSDPKTKFLGSFGLVPKRICSKKTLMKFAKEKKRKRAHEIQHMLHHQHRKNLRDRNKLNKIKLKEQRDKRAFLDKFKRKSLPYSSKCATNSSSGNQLRNFNNDGGNTEDSEIEVVKVVPRDNEPEIIEISSSDDEDETSASDYQSLLMCTNSRNITTSGEVSRASNFQHGNIIGPVQFEQEIKKSSDNVKTVFTNNPQVSFSLNNNAKNYPIFSPYFLPPSSKAEVAILPPMCPPKIILNRNKPVVSTNNINIKAIKLPSNCFIQGKNTILQPISNMKTAKIAAAQPLLAPRAIRKLPNETNIYWMQKQSSGIVTMVPCRPAIAVSGKNVVRSKENETGRPVSVVPPMKPISISKEYRSILPVTGEVKAMKTQQILDESKLYIDEEMSKLSKWIGMMKSTIAQTHFRLNVQKSKQKLDCQLNAGIGIIKKIRRKLYEIEKLEEQINVVSTSNDSNLIERLDPLIK